MSRWRTVHRRHYKHAKVSTNKDAHNKIFKKYKAVDNLPVDNVEKMEMCSGPVRGKKYGCKGNNLEIRSSELPTAAATQTAAV